MKTADKIIETAIKLFVNNGFENTPTSLISEEAKVATGTLFHHFKTKVDLINMAFIYSSERVVESFHSIEENSDSREYFRSFWNAGMRWALSNQPYIKFVLKYSDSPYISKITMVNSNDILKPYYNLLSKVLNRNSIKPLPQIIQINIYNQIFKVFFDYLCELDKIDDSIIEMGCEVIWDAFNTH